MDLSTHRNNNSSEKMSFFSQPLLASNHGDVNIVSRINDRKTEEKRCIHICFVGVSMSDGVVVKRELWRCLLIKRGVWFNLLLVDTIT